MTATMEILFNYAQEHMVRPLLLQEGKYTHAVHCSEQHEETLRTHIDSGAEVRLDHLLREEELITFLLERALFRAGFQIAMELMR